MNTEQDHADFEAWRIKHYNYDDLDAFEVSFAFEAFKAGRAALQSQDREDAERYRWLRDGGNDDIGVVSGFGCTDSGSSNVVGTYEYILDGEQLDAAIDHAMKIEGQ